MDPESPRTNDNEATIPSRTSPFDIIIHIAGQSSSSLSQALAWLVMIARSGIDVPINIFEQFLSMVTSPTAILSQVHSFVYAMALCLWLRSQGRQNFQSLFGRLHSAVGSAIVTALKGKDSELKGLS